MRDADSDRGVSTVLGAMLLLGILLVAASLHQTTAVPAANERAEFRHSQRVRADLVAVAGAVRTAGTTGSGTSTMLDLGVRYPSHGPFVNPPPATGRLTTSSTATVRIQNASGTGSEAADYWDGTARTYATKHLAYQADYHVYPGDSTTTIEYGSPVTRLTGGTSVIWTPSADLIDGRQITLTTLSGNVSRQGVRQVAVDPTAASPSATDVHRVVVEGRDGPLTLRLPTQHGESTWCERASGEALLEEELARNGGYVTDCTVQDGTLVLELARTRNGSTVRYALGLARVSVSGEPRRPTPAYLTVRTPTTIRNGTPRVLAVVVRDRYGNPLPGVSVTATDPSGILEEETVVSDKRGIASFTFVGGVTGNATVRIGESPAEQVSFNVTGTEKSG